ncbi:methyl-accepting chemotaxis protein [Herbaspirillum huttiense]|uniref:Methyl-accepting chemotaxis protein n=1 Tax=Herbaspirillum huttiense subsp. lycopersici TaxID=3074428 RepID=A0ABU2EF06_9BURK|nr:methyl-accepting chemotaxis protein [Herbaspirillum huttiense]MDR9846718.1 methyl-accepting chemotaxis protein [Herbaspirillum huttiense SE1]
MGIIHALRTRVRAQPHMPAEPGPTCQAALVASMQLDEEIAVRLKGAVEQTENSSLAIMSEARALCDRSAQLLERMQRASQENERVRDEMLETVDALVSMTEFLRSLPERMRRDVESIARIAEEIDNLSDLAQNVQAISTQSHLLSINTAIEASRAGQQGAAFKVIASEVRNLAANSHTAAARIRTTLSEVRKTLHDELGGNTAQSAADLDRIAATAEAVGRLRSSFEHVRDTSDQQYAQMMAHGEELVATTGNMLGHLQFQDVVRQCVERVQYAVDRRNAALAQMAGETTVILPAHEAATVIAQVVIDYVEQEHRHLVREPDLPAMELF